ncbi:MAG: hypothetical protein LQ346_006816, partial [Caloplaca aetnensis]
MAHHGQNDNATPSEPSDSWTPPYASQYYGPDPTTTHPDDAYVSSRPISANAFLQSMGGSVLRSSQQPSYPLYYNSSAASGPTATYGTAVSSGFISGNYSLPQQTAAPLDATSTPLACNCPPPLTVTIQNTVSAPPSTITITSTITASPEPSTQITPTVTITITSTVCGGNGQITSVAGNGTSAMISKAEEQGSGGEALTGTGALSGLASEATSESAPIVETSAAPNPINTHLSPQVTGTGAGGVVQSSQPPFTNETGSAGPSFPIGTKTYQPATSVEILPSNNEEPHITGSPGSQELPPPSLSNFPGEAATNATTVAPPAPYLSTKNFAESQSTSVQYPGSMTNSRNGSQDVGSTQAVPQVPSAVPYGNGSAVPTNTITSQQGHESVPVVSSAPPPYGFMNSTSIGMAGTTERPPQTNLVNPETSVIPPTAPVTSSSPQPISSTAAQPSVPIPAPFQTPMYPMIPNNATTLAANMSGPAGGSTSISQMPPSVPPIYATVTHEVIPMPLTTTDKNVATTKLYGNFHGSVDSGATTANRTTAQGTTMAGPSTGGSTTSNKDEETTLVPAPMTTSPQTTSPSTMPPLPPSSTPVDSPPVPPSNPAPTSPSTPAPPASTTTNLPNPACPPSNNPITADFNTFKLTKPPLPTPYLSLSYTGFTLSNGSPTPHLTSLASSSSAKTISIAPGSSFNLSSIALACAAPPCNITMWGQSVPGAARTLLTKRVQVDAA